MKKFWLFLGRNPLSGVLGRGRILRFWNLSSFWTVLLFRAICEPTFPIALLYGSTSKPEAITRITTASSRDRERQERGASTLPAPREQHASTGTVTAKSAIINAITHNLG